MIHLCPGSIKIYMEVNIGIKALDKNVTIKNDLIVRIQYRLMSS